MKRSKEIAKFFAGFAANQVLTHGALAIAGLEFKLLGIQYTRAMNTGGAIFWGAVMLALATYAWRKD